MLRFYIDVQKLVLPIIVALRYWQVLLKLRSYVNVVSIDVVWAGYIRILNQPHTGMIIY